MPDHIDAQHRRRSMTRREEDREDREVTEFNECPKFARHELDREQLKEIVEEVLRTIDTEERREAQMKWIYKNLMADSFKEGRGIVYSFVVFLGFVAMVAYGWLSNHPFK